MLDFFTEKKNQTVPGSSEIEKHFFHERQQLFNRNGTFGENRGCGVQWIQHVINSPRAFNESSGHVRIKVLNSGFAQ